MDTGYEKKKRRQRRPTLAQMVDKVQRHERNAAEHRGDKEALAHMRDLSRYAAGAMALVAPYKPDGSRAERGDMTEFMQWADLLVRLCGLRIPYERPRLASITLRDETPQTEDVYQTVRDLQEMMLHKGVPITHLTERRLIIEHEADAGAPTNGSGGNGRAS